MHFGENDGNPGLRRKHTLCTGFLHAGHVAAAHSHNHRRYMSGWLFLLSARAHVDRGVLECVLYRAQWLPALAHSGEQEEQPRRPAAEPSNPNPELRMLNGPPWPLFLPGYGLVEVFDEQNFLVPVESAKSPDRGQKDDAGKGG